MREEHRKNKAFAALVVKARWADVFYFIREEKKAGCPRRTGQPVCELWVCWE